MSAADHIKKSAALRGKGQFDEAIAEIENNRASFDEITIEVALLQAIYAAAEKGDDAKAKSLAQELATYDPDIPTVKKYLP